MLNFTFQNPTKILFGEGRIADIAREIPPNSRILITYGGGSVKRYGTLDEVKAALSGFYIQEFGSIEPNPTYDTLMQAVALVKAERIDFLLAVGGGSVIDGTKFIAAAALFEEADCWQILAQRIAVERALPLGTVLTLPATGSEMNPTAVVTNPALKAKLAFVSPRVYPRFSVLDPTKTYTLPVRQVGNGVVDAFVHVVEQYLTYPVNAKVQDRFAEGLLLTLIEEGPKALAEPENYAVRANIMWAATLALNGLIGAGVPQDWATHRIGHELTAQFGLDHAQTLAILLPNVLTLCKNAKRAKLLQYATRVWNITQGDEDSRINQAIAATRAFFEQMQLKTYLRDYGIDQSHLAVIAEQLKAHDNVTLGEHKNITPEISQRIIEMSF